MSSSVAGIVNRNTASKASKLTLDLVLGVPALPAIVVVDYFDPDLPDTLAEGMLVFLIMVSMLATSYGLVWVVWVVILNLQLTNWFIGVVVAYWVASFCTLKCLFDA